MSEVELEKPQRKELLAVINEESDRLNRLVGEAAEVAQLDARQVELAFRAAPHSRSRRCGPATIQDTLWNTIRWRSPSRKHCPR